MSCQTLVKCRECGKPLTRDNVGVLDDMLCRECEKKKMEKETKWIN